MKNTLLVGSAKMYCPCASYILAEPFSRDTGRRNEKHAAGGLAVGDLVRTDERKLHTPYALLGALGMGKRVECFHCIFLLAPADRDPRCDRTTKLDSSCART